MQIENRILFAYFFRQHDGYFNEHSERVGFWHFRPLSTAGVHWLCGWPLMSRHLHQYSVSATNECATRWQSPTPRSFIGARWYASESDLSHQYRPSAQGRLLHTNTQTETDSRLNGTRKACPVPLRATSEQKASSFDDSAVYWKV